jgi:hypothetical protein
LASRLASRSGVSPIPEQLVIGLAYQQQITDQWRRQPPKRKGGRRIGGRLRGAGRSWWLWKWLDEEVLRDADSSAVAGL